MTEPNKRVVWPFCLNARVALRRFFLIVVCATFLGPVMHVLQPDTAQAQTYRHQNRGLFQGPGQNRGLRRPRMRVVKKTKKSFLGGLFGSQPPRRRARASRNRGLKPLLSGLSVPRLLLKKPATLRASYANRMRAAAARDAARARRKLRGGFGTGARRAGFAQGSSANWGRGKYRTMCVRTCDGYYFPVSFKARLRDFGTDERRCDTSCYNAPTKLFYYSNPGGSIENMRTLEGERYKDMANAFRYRQEFVADCRCKAEPWTEQARQQHESWAQQKKDQQRQASLEQSYPQDEVLAAQAEPIDHNALLHLN